MISFKVDLVSNDGARREPTSFEIPISEWNILHEFHDDVEKLRSTKFVQNKMGGQIAIQWNISTGLQPNSMYIDQDAVWAVLMKLRPFLLQNEVHNFHKIKKILKRRLTHAAFHKQIDALDQAFSLRTMEKRISLRGPGRIPLSGDVVMDWLNAFEYHQDKSKREAVKVDLGIFFEEKNGLPIVLFALVDMIQSILWLGDLVETIMLIKQGKLLEIKCPLDYLENT